MRRLRTLLLTLWLGLGCAALAHAEDQISEHWLENGLKILVKVDRRAPVVVSQLWYKVGSSYEHDGITGLSHMLEHMLFKGTETLKPGEFSATIARYGGDENAFTSKHYTAYYQRIAKEHLELCLRLEADRMRNLVFDPDEFMRELAVVKEERFQRTEDQPRAYLYERFNAIAYLTSGNRLPIVGWLDDLNHMTMADAKAWYGQWYAPNNAALVVVGDVDPEQVFALAKRYFGPLQAQPLPALKPRVEIDQSGTRRLTVKRPGNLPFMIMGYAAPSLLTAEDPAEVYALLLLGEVLNSGESSRFPRHLIRGKQVAAAAGAGIDIYDRLQTLFTLDATPAAGHTLEELEQALLAEIELIQQGDLQVAELERVKTQLIAKHVYQQDSIFYQAMRIGIVETVGLGHEVLAEYLDRIRAVTPADIQAVAKKYLRPEGLTVGYLVPEAGAL